MTAILLVIIALGIAYCGLALDHHMTQLRREFKSYMERRS